MNNTFHALTEPRRRRILELVRDRELSAGKIAEKFDVTEPAISQHLKVLLDAGLLNVRREGTRKLYRLRPEGLKQVRAYLESFWAQSLSQLKSAAEAEEQD
jgi:DNA-binding transcriptional ArsR family regulator